MLKKLLMLSFFSGIAIFQSLSADVQWLTNYREAVSQAQANQKPIAVLFTGTEWCHWCKKLEEDILAKPEFSNTIGNKLVFLKLDFPMTNPLPADQTQQNQELRRKFGVTGFPSIVILNPSGAKIGQEGYEPVAPREYAERLLKYTN